MLDQCDTTSAIERVKRKPTVVVDQMLRSVLSTASTVKTPVFRSGGLYCAHILTFATASATHARLDM